MKRIPYVKYSKPKGKYAASENSQRHLLQKRVIEWLMTLTPPPTGLACNVPTKMVLDRADVAGLWSAPVRHAGKTLLEPSRSVAVVCALTREECWAAGVNPEQLHAELNLCNELMSKYEDIIRLREPELRQDNMLFEEYAEWNFAASRNDQYQLLREQQRELNSHLYRGTRLERIRDNAVADQLYLAIPEGIISPDEMMSDWGIIAFPAEPSAAPVILRESQPHSVSRASRIHFANNILSAAARYVLAGNGVSC